MQIVIKIPESEIPKKQDIIEIPLHFIDEKVCEVGKYGFNVLPKGHGRLIDAYELLKQSYRIDDSATLSTRDVVNVEDVEDATAIIESDKSESEDV